jgi:hypothetical protein
MLRRALSGSLVLAFVMVAMVAAPIGVACAQQGVGPAVSPGKTRPAVPQGTLKQGNSPGQRSAQSDCVREANRRGYSVLETGNFQQYNDGWSIDLRVRDMRNRVSNGSCFVETRTGDVTLYGFGWGYDDDGDDQMTFNCASADRKYRECQTPINGRVRLVKQLSDSACIQGRTWGQRGDRIWVDAGCRARFEVSRYSGGGGGGGGGSGNTIRCESDVNRYRECQIGPGYFGRLLQDNSGGRCREGSTWGTRNGVIWVANGCRAVFERQRGNSGNNGNNGNNGSGGGFGGSGGSSGDHSMNAARRACEDEARRRGFDIRETSEPYPTGNGYTVQMKIRKPDGDKRLYGCRYNSSTGSVKLDPM